MIHSFRVKSCGEDSKSLLYNIPEQGCDKFKSMDISK